MVVGTDVPGFTADAIRTAGKLLHTFDVVFGPAEDGGFYLVATKHPMADVFRNVRWSTGTVLHECECNAAEARLNVAPRDAMPSLIDIDNIEVRFRLRPWACFPLAHDPLFQHQEFDLSPALSISRPIIVRPMAIGDTPKWLTLSKPQPLRYQRSAAMSVFHCDAGPEALAARGACIGSVRQLAQNDARSRRSFASVAASLTFTRRSGSQFKRVDNLTRVGDQLQHREGGSSRAIARWR